MPNRGKKYKAASATYNREELYGLIEAAGIVKDMASAKFDETVELAMRLGVDPRKADQIVRGTVSLPAGLGKTVKVAVFASGEAAAAAREAGADIVGDKELVDQFAAGAMDYDVVISTPDLMGQVGRLGKVLGPRGLMPNPKTGTVTTDVAKAVTDFKGGRVEYRTDKVGNIQVPVGKASFTKKQIVQNLSAVIDEVVRVKPSSAKGKYVRTITISTTMGPGVKVDTNKASVSEEDLASV